MNMFSKFKSENDGVESGGDVVGGFKLLDSNIYAAAVKLLFFGASEKGAQFAEVHLTVDNDGQPHEFRERIYMTTKKGENTYTDKRSGAVKFMPGFETINDLCLVTTGYGLVDMADDIEEKVFNLYDPETRSEKPQNVPCLPNVMGQRLLVGITQEIEDKTKLEGDEYVPTGETRSLNKLSKCFHEESGRTVTEIKADKDEPIFAQKWLERNMGQVIDRSKGKPEQGKTGAPPAASSGAPAKSSGLFGAK